MTCSLHRSVSHDDDNESKPYMCWHMSSCDVIASCDLITVADCVTAARDRLDDLLVRMMRCELDDFEIVSWDHVMLNYLRALQFLRVVYKNCLYSLSLCYSYIPG